MRDLRFSAIRDAVGMVTQDGHLFHETIAENLRYAAPGSTEDEMHDALRRARLGDLLDALPDGLDTVVGERGYRLSGGERQRLTIARLLLARPRVVILDEATAHLDSESEAAVQEALTEALAGAYRDRHRAPALDGARRRPDRGDRGRTGGGERHARGAARRRRPVRDAVPDAVRPDDGLAPPRADRPSYRALTGAGVGEDHRSAPAKSCMHAKGVTAPYPSGGTGAGEPMPELDRRGRRRVLAVCCCSLFVVGMDITIVNLALPAIGRTTCTPATPVCSGRWTPTRWCSPRC